MINLGMLSDFDLNERSALQRALDATNAAIADPGFLATLMAATYTSTPLSNEVVLARLNQTIVIQRLYCETMGFWATYVSKTEAEESPDGTVTFNRHYFDRQTLPSLANTLFHETWHVLGLHHISARDFRSWPYQAGDLLQQYLEAKATS